MFEVQLEWSPAVRDREPFGLDEGVLPEAIRVPALPYEGTVIDDLPGLQESVEVDFVVYNAQAEEFTLFVILA